MLKFDPVAAGVALLVVLIIAGLIWATKGQRDNTPHDEGPQA